MSDKQPRSRAIKPVEGATGRQLPAAEIERGRNAKTKHGLYRARVGLPRNERLRLRKYTAEIRKIMPWLRESDLPTVQSLASTLVLRDKIAVRLTEVGLTTDEGSPRRLVGEYRQVLQLCLTYCTALGLTPQTRTQLGLRTAKGKRLSLEDAMGMGNDNEEDD